MATAYKPSEVFEIVEHLISRKDAMGRLKKSMAPYIQGGAGIAKTAMVNQLAEKRGARAVPLHLSQLDPTDLTGVPVVQNDGTMRWVPSSKMPARIIQRGKPLSKEYYLKSPFIERAEHIAVYGFDHDGNEIARYNDNDFEDSGLEVEARLVNGGVKVDVKVLDDRVETLEVSEKAIVFLDELSTADEATQNAALQLVEARMVGEYIAPTGAVFIAAGNRTTDGAFVTPMSGPLANRFAHLTMKPDVDEWIEYAMKVGMRPEVIAYVKAFPDVIHDFDDNSFGEGQYAFATPRTLEYLSQNFITPNENNRALVHAMAASIIGQTRAAQFMGYVDVFHRFPNVDEVFAGNDPKIDSDIEPSVRFGFLVSILQNLGNEFNKFKDDGSNEARERWEIGRDNTLQYIMDHFSREAAHFTIHYLVHVIKVPGSYMSKRNGENSEVANKFGKEFTSLSARLNKLR